MNDLRTRLEASLSASYRLERELGGGGMAVVYLAHDLRHKRRVALKVLRPEISAVMGPERFLREIETLANLTHPHILPLHDSGGADGLLYYVMPYIEGESLRDRLLREKQLPLDDALRIAREVADALSHAHGRGVIHRDIKPENILLSGGHALVADFGIAAAIDVAGGSRLTETGIAMGTPAYMSPEQVLGERAIDARADVYALGCVLYEMLAGEPPFTGPTAQVVMTRRVHEPAPSVRRIRELIPDALDQTITKTLARLPADRFAAAEQFIEAISSYDSALRPDPSAARDADGRAAMGSAERSGWSQAVLRFLSRRQTQLISLLVVTVLVSATALAAFLSRRVPLAPYRAVVIPFENQTNDSTLDDLGRMAAHWITDVLTRSQAVEIVPTPVALSAWGFIQQQSKQRRVTDPVREMAEETGAAIVISGSYYRDGSGVRLHAQITDAARGRVLAPVQHLTGSTSVTSAAIDSLAERVLSVVASATPEMQTSRGGVLTTVSAKPPSFAALAALLEGLDAGSLRGDWRLARQHLYAAAMLDTSFVNALLWAGVASLNIFDNRAADSLATVVVQRAGNRLNPFESAMLRWIRSSAIGEWQESYSANQELARIAPQSGFTYNVGYFAYLLNRPREGIQWLSKLDPERGFRRSFMYYGYFLANMHHALEDHERELKTARQGRRRFPDQRLLLESELKAVAARGNLRNVSRLIDESVQLKPGGFQLSLVETAALELRAHGYAAEAAEVANRAIQLYRTRTDGDSAAPRDQLHFARLLHITGRLAEAQAILQALIQENPTNMNVKGSLALTAAGLGDRAQAERISRELAELDRTYLQGEHTYWRAQIAAALGDKGTALRLLGTAIQHGKRHDDELHRNVAFASLRGDPGFREILRPKG